MSPFIYPESVYETTSDAAQVFATLTRRNGWQYRFELVDLSPLSEFTEVPFPAGRLISVKSPQGFEKTFTYKFNVTDTDAGAAERLELIQEYPKRQLMIDKATDSYGNTASYSYAADQLAGRFVVSEIAIDADGADPENALTTLIYHYDFDETQRLQKVERKVGAGAPVLVSEYTFGQDPVLNCDSMHRVEIGSDGRRTEETILLSGDYTMFEEELVSQFASRLIARKDGAGHQYLTLYRGGGDQPIYRALYRER